MGDVNGENSNPASKGSLITEWCNVIGGSLFVYLREKLQVDRLNEGSRIHHLVGNRAKQNPILVLTRTVVEPESEMFGVLEGGLVEGRYEG